MTGEEERAARALFDYVLESADVLDQAMVVAEAGAVASRGGGEAAWVNEAWGRWVTITDAARALATGAMGAGEAWPIERLYEELGGGCGGIPGRPAARAAQEDGLGSGEAGTPWQM